MRFSGIRDSALSQDDISSLYDQIRKAIGNGDFNNPEFQELMSVFFGFTEYYDIR